MAWRRRLEVAAVLTLATAVSPSSVSATGESTVSLSAEYAGTTWCVRVEGSREPVRLLLRNMTPGVLALEGGPVQVVTTGGGADNAVCRQFQRTGPGPGALSAKLAEEVAPFPVSGSCAETSPDGSCSRREKRVWRTSSHVAVEVFPFRVAFATKRGELALTLTRGSGSVLGEPAYRLPEVEQSTPRATPGGSARRGPTAGCRRSTGVSTPII